MLKQTEGSRAVAEAVALCRPQVICAYPITPQTHIVEGLGEMVKSGQLSPCEFINVESEFAALSVAIGASAAGAPGTIGPAKASASGVFSGEPCRVDGTDRRPLFTSARAKAWRLESSSTASRNNRLTSLLGVMKSVARVELRMFSSAAYSRSLA